MDLLKVDIIKGVQRAMADVFANAKMGVPKSEGHDLIVLVHAKDKSKLTQFLKPRVESWQLGQLKHDGVESVRLSNGTLWVITLNPQKDTPRCTHDGRMLKGSYGYVRDVVGAFWRTNKLQADVQLHFIGLKEEEIEGALVAVGLAQYKFLQCYKAEALSPQQFYLTRDRGGISKETIARASAILRGMNLSRHLSNLPAADANPQSLCEVVKSIFSKRKNVKIEIWNDEDLKKEGFGLLYGVGRGSEHGARLIRLRYKPAKASKKAARTALVGKGVTFDTGGLDIKPSSGMRLMKKDMSGAATVAGLCFLASELKLSSPMDFYLPLAENAVSDRATRPGDVHKSFAGKLVEIDNTDAEGRLVMADAISFAVSGKGADAISELIDVSTLTGAMRVAVGLDVAGFFTNKDVLSKKIENAAQKAGEFAWRMPLVDKYNRSLNSQYADLKNSSEGGFGGAITAALFLERFVGQTPWVHFDVMSWNNSADGAVSDGANAQCFQIIARHLGA